VQWAVQQQWQACAEQAVAGFGGRVRATRRGALALRRAAPLSYAIAMPRARYAFMIVGCCRSGIAEAMPLRAFTVRYAAI